MKKLFLLVPLFLTSALVANSAPFAAQSDLVGDLSAATLNGFIITGLDVAMHAKGVSG